MDKPIIPIGYCKYRTPRGIKASISPYTPEGRNEIYKSFDIDIDIMRYMLENPARNMSIEYNDNRISLYTGQCGKRAITGEKLTKGNMECHHKIPREVGGDDTYKNLIFVMCPPSKNGHKKASKNEMNRSISLIYENRPHLFHGLLDNEPLPA